MGYRCIRKWLDDNRDLLRIHNECVLPMACTRKNSKVKGFEASGLWPFNPSAVDYDVLDKSKKTLDKQKDSNNEDQVEKQTFLKNFETSLPPNLLLDFKNASSTGLWNGDVEKRVI